MQAPSNQLRLSQSPTAAWAAILVGCIMFGGCTRGERIDRAALLSNRSAFVQAAPVRTTSIAPTVRTDETESEPVREAKLTGQAEPQVAPDLVEPGAVAIVEAILDGMGERVVGNDGITRISLVQIRNQSRAHVTEFNAFRERLASLLSDATGSAQQSKVEFTGSNQIDGQYVVHGAAYLINANGIDMWELFVSVLPVQQRWTVWESPRPVRVLRHPEPGQPQIVAW